jgi:hypothetical protein
VAKTRFLIFWTPAGDIARKVALHQRQHLPLVPHRPERQPLLQRLQPRLELHPGRAPLRVRGLRRGEGNSDQ